jgi:hypothetical protein
MTKGIVSGVVCVVVLSFATAGGEPKEVQLRGKLRTGIVAIGGETTGTVIDTDKGRFELDLGNNKELRAKAERLDGKAVVVKGTLTIRKGVEVKERRILAVRSLEAAEDGPKAKADVSGVITRVNLAGDDGKGSFLVEGKKGGGATYDKAWVRVTGKTKIEQLADGQRRPARFEDLRKDCLIEAWFSGPVAESYPVQATAGVILILEKAR